MPFEIAEFTEARLATVTTRIEKHSDEDKPAVSLGLELTVANTMLDVIDPTIRPQIYKAVEGQDQLPGIEVSTPVLRSNSFDRHTLIQKYDGWTLHVDDGIDDTAPMTFGSCKVDKLSVEAKQGGSVVLRVRVGTSDLDAERSGMLGMHIGQSIWVMLKAPQKQPEAIDASSTAKDLPPDAGDMFAQQHNGSTSEVSAEGAWPFPGSPPDEAPPQAVLIEPTRSGTRTARGREKTKAALEAGMKAAEDGTHPTH